MNPNSSTTNAESSGGVGHKHPAVPGSAAVAEIAEIFGSTFHNFVAGTPTDENRLQMVPLMILIPLPGR